MSQVSEVMKIRRKLLTEISRLAYNGDLLANIDEIVNEVVTEEGPRYRCCVHKERAVLKDRINLALGQPLRTKLADAAENAVAGETAELPIISVLPEACDRCPIDKFMVTDACRNCLAHSCIASCPKKAIMIVQNRAYIDKNKCVECGLCKRSCSYGAIIEISRPCERACELNAITAGSDRRAVIDYDKCVSCGACQTACPFGAICDPSEIVQLIKELKSKKPVHAILAPSFIGQFGIKVTPGQIVAALRQLGFAEIQEAALGADIVANVEAAEFIAAMNSGQPYMTTSCCPAFVKMVEKHFPASSQFVSTTVSPMVAVAKTIKNANPDAMIAFIGPCVAKKAEARQYPGLIDFVLTFEELASMLVGAGINVTEIAADNEFATAASHDAIVFAKSGGVAQAVANALAKTAETVAIRPYNCNGLADCKAILGKVHQGNMDINLIEGMACVGGCVGGPGILTDQRVTTRLVEQFASKASAATAKDNAKATHETDKAISWHRK